jgi:hypothetical protein
MSIPACKYPNLRTIVHKNKFLDRLQGRANSKRKQEDTIKERAEYLGSLPSKG